VNFSNGALAGGFGVSNAGGKIVVDGSGFVHKTDTETIAGDKTLSGNTTFTGTTTVTNSTSTGTASTITAASLTSGQALNVQTDSAFTTGAGTGFFYNGGTPDTSKGATTISSTGAFTGTLVALTADHTQTGTVLGISAQALTTGKAVDVSLGTLYSGTTDAQGSIGAVNIRAKSFTGNVFNVSAEGAAGATGANLANFKSNQINGNVVNVTGDSITTGNGVNISTTGLSGTGSAGGKAVAVTVGTAGTPIYVSTATSGYAGNVIDLWANNASKFSVTEAGTLTLAGNLLVRGGTITGPTSGAFAIDNGNASAINLGNASGLAPINIGTANASTVTIGRAAKTTTIGGPLSVLGATITGPTSGAFAIDNGNASAINIGNASGLAPINIGTANASTVTIGRSTQATVVNGTLQSVGDFTVGSPVKLTITAATGDVTAAGFGLFGSSAANQIKLLGAANGSPVQIAALGAS